MILLKSTPMIPIQNIYIPYDIIIFIAINTMHTGQCRTTRILLLTKHQIRLPGVWTGEVFPTQLHTSSF